MRQTRYRWRNAAHKLIEAQVSVCIANPLRVRKRALSLSSRRVVIGVACVQDRQISQVADRRRDGAHEVVGTQ